MSFIIPESDPNCFLYSISKMAKGWERIYYFSMSYLSIAFFKTEWSLFMFTFENEIPGTK